jgi:hypothetical protein
VFLLSIDHDNARRPTAVQPVAALLKEGCVFRGNWPMTALQTPLGYFLG